MVMRVPDTSKMLPINSQPIFWNTIFLERRISQNHFHTPVIHISLARKSSLLSVGLKRNCFNDTMLKTNKSTIFWITISHNSAVNLNVFSKHTLSGILLAFYSLFFFLLILVTANGRPKPELCFLPGRLRWTLLPKEHYSNSLSGCGSNTQPSNWEADTLPLNYCRASMAQWQSKTCRRYWIVSLTDLVWPWSAMSCVINSFQIGYFYTNGWSNSNL